MRTTSDRESQRQGRILEAKRDLLSVAIDLVADAEHVLRTGKPGAGSIYRRIIEVVEMQQDNEEWLNRYKDLLEKKRIRLLSMSQGERHRTRQNWLDLFAEVRSALDDDPAGPRGQAIAARCLEIGRRTLDATDDELAKHFKAQPESLNAGKEFSTHLSDADLARVRGALEPFSDPRVRDWLRKAFAATRA